MTTERVDKKDMNDAAIAVVAEREAFLRIVNVERDRTNGDSDFSAGYMKACFVIAERLRARSRAS